MIAKWKNTISSSNFPMALDGINNRLYIGYRSPATLGVINTKDGNEIHSINCSGDADDVFCNDSLVYVSAGKGYPDIFKTTQQNTLERITHLESSSGARTSLLLPTEKNCCLPFLPTMAHWQPYGFNYESI